MNIRLVVNLLGRLLLVDSAFMSPALIIALIDRTPDAGALGAVMALTAVIGLLMALVRPRSDTLRPREVQRIYCPHLLGRVQKGRPASDCGNACSIEQVAQTVVFYTVSVCKCLCYTNDSQ